MSNEECLKFEIDGSLARITLNRPEKLNAIDNEMHKAFLDALLEITENPDLRAVLFASSGKAFSAGGNLDMMKELNANLAQRKAMTREGIRIVNTMIDLDIPVVVALHGDAIGLGATLVLGGDVIVASKTARIADPHVKVGLVAGDGGCLFWPAAMGMIRAKRYLLTGDALGAEDAWRMGLVTDLVDTPEEVLPEAEKFAQRFTEMAPLAVQGTKASLNLLLKSRAAEAFEHSMAREVVSLGSDDLLEAIASFQEKRKPEFKNR